MAIPAATTDHRMAISEQATMRRSQNIPSPLLGLHYQCLGKLKRGLADASPRPTPNRMSRSTVLVTK